MCPGHDRRADALPRRAPSLPEHAERTVERDGARAEPHHERSGHGENEDRDRSRHDGARVSEVARSEPDDEATQAFHEDDAAHEEEEPVEEARAPSEPERDAVGSAARELARADVRSTRLAGRPRGHGRHGIVEGPGLERLSLPPRLRHGLLLGVRSSLVQPESIGRRRSRPRRSIASRRRLPNGPRRLPRKAPGCSARSPGSRPGSSAIRSAPRRCPVTRRRCACRPKRDDRRARERR